ncbi:MAG: flagellar biosynthesis protein FlgA [Candidatus Brocadia sp. WS118]|nr:MAG: flagellar biosynthesis protein FlgA [Candidatus Brocadia sp. WS118]
MHRTGNKRRVVNSILRYARTIYFIVLFSCITPYDKFANAAIRVKDMAYVKGVRDNQLYGYGLVAGLQGSGDSQIFRVTRQLAVNIFEKLGVLITESDFLSKNIAAVMITVNIPAFARPGDKLDVVVSSIGDAKSLEGGVLLQTALQGADNEVYAVAQGPLSIGGYNIEGQAQTVRKNISTTAYISNGAIVEKEIQVSLLHGKSLSVILRDPDFTTANRLVDVINTFYPNTARAIDAAVVTIVPPKDFQSEDAVIRFVANIEELHIKPDSIARVIINERTGTIVAGENVRISTIAVAHGNLSITITEKPEVSQPGALSSGTTAIVPRTDIQAEEEEKKLNIIQEGVTISDVARALNILGVTPRDLISIFQAIKRAGALHAELVIM